MSDQREEFRMKLHKLCKLRADYAEQKLAIQTEMQEELAREDAKIPREPWDKCTPDVRLLLAGKLSDLRKPFLDRQSQLWQECSNGILDLEVDLYELANVLPVHSGKLRVLLADIASQTNGRAACMILIEDCKRHGIDAQYTMEAEGCVCQSMRSPAITHRVYVLVEEPLDSEILSRKKPMEVREQVRLCWKHGLDPRLCNPFLASNFEELHGLDRRGNDLWANRGSGTGAA